MRPSWIGPCFAIRLFLFQFLLLLISSCQRVPRKALTDPREERSPALTPVAFSVILFYSFNVKIIITAWIIKEFTAQLISNGFHILA